MQSLKLDTFFFAMEKVKPYLKKTFEHLLHKSYGAVFLLQTSTIFEFCF